MKIYFKMVTDETFSLSEQIYGASGKITNNKDARVQKSLILENLLFFECDEGKTLMVKQIAYAWIDD